MNYAKWLTGKLALPASLCLPVLILGQNVVAPSSHWGSTMYPELRPSRTAGLHLVGFTQFGKELDTSGQYDFESYNDIEETLGFNFLAYSRTGYANRSNARSNLLRRTVITLGIISDVTTEWLQNDVIHAGLLADPLDPIPRDSSDTKDQISTGPTRFGIYGYSEEVTYRINTRAISTSGQVQYIPTPLFVGGGLSISNLQVEGFVQYGASHFLKTPRNLIEFRRFFRLDYADFSAMSRRGVLLPARIYGPILPYSVFKDIASGYTSTQGSITLYGEFLIPCKLLGLFHLPLVAQFTITNASGLFVARRDQQARERAKTDDREVSKVYQSKSPLKERFLSVKIRLGSFIFETSNDIAGGKDKGPSFTASFYVNLSP